MVGRHADCCPIEATTCTHMHMCTSAMLARSGRRGGGLFDRAVSDNCRMLVEAKSRVCGRHAQSLLRKAREALRMTMSTTWAPRRACELAHGLRQPGPSRKEAAGALSSGEAAGGARRLCRQCGDGDVSNTNSAASRSCHHKEHGQLEHCRARMAVTNTHLPHRTSECRLCAGASPAPSSEKAGGLPGGTILGREKPQDYAR